MTDEELAAEKKTTVKAVIAADDGTHADFEDFVEEGREFSAKAGRAAEPASSFKVGTIVMLILAWLAVGAPLAWGVWVTLQKTAAMFH
jgi:hypothetical protein